MRFVDTAYLLALLDARDQWHPLALRISRRREHALISTTWVMMELGNALNTPPQRQIFVSFVRAIVGTERLQLVPATEEWFARGFDLYKKRPDKHWSLTDCISFLVMQDWGITDALTSDRHFAQAGFRVLLQNGSYEE